MEIREIKQQNLKLLEESIQTTKRGIQLVKNSLDPFGNEQEDYESEGEKGIDPTKFMSKKEVKEWNRLSAHRQAKFIKRGLKEASLHQSQQKVEENVRKVFREELIQQELAGIKRNSHIYEKSKNSFKTKESGKERTEQIRGNQGGSHRTTGAETREVSCEKGGFHTQSGETVQAMSGKSFSETQAASSTGGAAKGTSAASVGGAAKTAGKSSGVGLAITAGKKAAEKFQESLTARAMAVQQAQQKLQESEAFGNLPKPVAYATAAVTATIASLAGIALHMVSTLLTALVAVISTVLPLVVLVCTVVVIFTSILTAITSSNSAGYNLPPFITQDMMECLFEQQEEAGIPVSTGIAQVIAESGFGLYGPGGESGKGLSQLAYDYKHIFGIKYFSTDPFATGAVNMQTGEEVNGDNITIEAGFAVYRDYVSCIKQRTWMLTRDPYAGQVAPYINENDGEYTKEDARLFIRGVWLGGWSTSSAYVDRCVTHMDTYNLYRFDNMTYEEYKSGLGGGSYNGVVTPSMKRIVDVAESNTGTKPCKPGWCAAWVTGVYQAAGAPVIPYGDAIDMWNTYRSTGSTSMENIPPGAIVCGSGSGSDGADYGHVGIYIGDGKVAHNMGYLSIQTLEDWCSWQTAVCQGHQGWIGWVFPGGVPTE